MISLNEESLKELSSRFWKHVKKTEDNGCWEWQGSKLTDGYGRVHYKNKAYKAHRIVWMLTYNIQVPPNLVICHYCDNKNCVKIEHLWMGTNEHNYKDMILKERHFHILKKPDVEMICKRYLNGETIKTIADSYNLDAATIYYHLKKNKVHKMPGSVTGNAPRCDHEKVREMKKTGLSNQKLADMFKVGKTTIWSILNPELNKERKRKYGKYKYELQNRTPVL